jgi:hypothetical protein
MGSEFTRTTWLRPFALPVRALRVALGGATMTTPVGRAHPKSIATSSVLGLIGLSHRVGASSHSALALRFAPPRCPKPSPSRLVYADTTPVIPDDMGIPPAAVLALSGRAGSLIHPSAWNGHSRKLAKKVAINTAFV